MNKVSYYLIIICLIIAPLAFGSVETWALLIMELLVTLSAISYSIYIVKENKSFYSVPGLVPLIILCEFILIQIIPLPQSLVKIISPSSWELYRNTVGIFSDTQFMTISVNKSATISEFMRFSSYLIFYVLSVQIFSDKDNIKKGVKTVSIFGFILAFSSICQLFLRKDYALWLRYVPDNAMIVGPYVCHNHYAGLMEMIFPLSAILYLYNKPTFIYGSFRERMIDSWGRSKMMESLKYAFFALTIAVSIFLSLSRGGIIGLLFGSVVFFSLLQFFVYKNKTGFINSAFFVVIMAFIITWFGWGDITSRFSDIKNEIEGLSYSRLAIWQDSLPLIKDFFVTGSGFGTYRWIFPAYLTFNGTRIVDHTHNDYLEFASNGGIIAIILIGLFLYSMITTGFKILKGRKDRYPVMVCIAAFSGLISIFLHSVFDFNMQIPANALYFVFLCSLFVAGSAVKTKNHSKKLTCLTEAGKSSPFLLLAFSIIVFLSALFIHGRLLKSEYLFSSIESMIINNSTDKETLDRLYSITDESMKTFPIDSKYSNAGAKIKVLSGQNAEALDLFKKAVALNPADTDILMRAGLLFDMLGQKDKANQLLASAVKYKQAGYDEHMAYALFLNANNQKDKAITIIKKILSFYNGDKKNQIADLENLFGMKLNEIKSILPERASYWISLANYCVSKNSVDVAESAFIKAQECPDTSPGTFMASADYFLKIGKNDYALQSLKTASEKFPDDIRIFELTAKLYENIGVTYRANEEYRKILMIDPSNKKARSKLGL